MMKLTRKKSKHTNNKENNLIDEDTLNVGIAARNDPTVQMIYPNGCLILSSKFIHCTTSLVNMIVANRQMKQPLKKLFEINSAKHMNIPYDPNIDCHNIAIIDK